MKENVLMNLNQLFGLSCLRGEWKIQHVFARFC